MARTVVFCDNCRRERDWPKPPVRVTEDPCDLCGGWDAYRKRDARTGEVKTIKLKNFEHESRFLPGTEAETRLQEPIG